MATTIVAHTYKLKRGKEDAVLNANPLLLAGEPIVVFRNDGTTNIKVGDGETYYRDLPWIGSDQIYCAKSRNSFPNVGSPTVIYKAEEESCLYQWNSTKLRYEPLGGGGTVSTEVYAEDVIGLQSFVDARIEAKVDTQVTDTVTKEIEILKTEFVTTETITVMEQSVKQVEASVEALDTLTQETSAEVKELSSQVETKADVETVEQINNTVVVLGQTVETKADTTRVEALETVVETKLDTEALEIVKVELAEQTAAQLEAFSAEVDSKIENKADDADIDHLQQQIDNLGEGVIESVGTVSGGTAEDLLASLT